MLLNTPASQCCRNRNEYNVTLAAFLLVPFTQNAFEVAASKLSEHTLSGLGLAFQQIDRPQYVGLVGFHNVSIHDHLIQ